MISSDSNKPKNPPQDHTTTLAASSDNPPRVLELMRDLMEARHYSPRTQDAYLGWVRRFVRFSGVLNWSELASLSDKDVMAFLTHLKDSDRVAASTQNQARAALVFLFEVLLQKGTLPEVFLRERAPRRVPVVLPAEEILKLLSHLEEPQRLMASLLYGSGLRLTECCRLRVKDIDLAARQIFVRRRRGRQDRLVPLPRCKIGDVARQLEVVRELHAGDLQHKGGWVQLPEEARHDPSRGQAFPWQWLFPSRRLFRDAATGQIRRHHLHETSLQKGVSKAALRAQLDRPVTCHTLRHSCATHLLEAGYDPAAVQDFLGHRSVSSALIYVPAVRPSDKVIRSPLDLLTTALSPPNDSKFSDVALVDFTREAEILPLRKCRQSDAMYRALFRPPQHVPLYRQA